MSKAFFVIQAITCLCQGFANTSKGSAMTRGTKMIISTINVLWSVFCVVFAIVKHYWIGIIFAVIVYFVFCALGAFLCDYLIKHPPK